MNVIAVDTIAAISTPLGAGAIAVVRLSGPRATDVLARVAPELGPAEPRSARLTAIRDPDTGELVDRAVVVVVGPADQIAEGLATLGLGDLLQVEA